MSYPALAGKSPANFMAAFAANLPLGMAAIKEVVESRKKGAPKGPVNYDPNSDVGKQIIRLMGADVPRQLLEQNYGVRFLFLNCCAPAVYLEGETFPTFEEQLQMQYDNQTGVTANADC